MIGKLILGQDEAILNDDLSWSSSEPSLQRYLSMAFSPEKNETAGRFGTLLLEKAALDLEARYELSPIDYTVPSDVIP